MYRQNTQKHILPFFPIRSCKKNTSPSPENFKIRAIGGRKGKRINSVIPEKIISKKRLILTFSDLDIYQSLYERTQARVQNTIQQYHL